MKVVSWNVNSIKARGERLTGWLQRNNPDVVCLQELKVLDEHFPHDALRELGYHAVVNCQKAYNGVAVLAREELVSSHVNIDDDVDDPQARLVSARIQGVHVISVYVPNGQSVGTDKYAYKLAWFKRLRAFLERHASPTEPLLLCGDFNVAPFDADVKNPDKWKDSVLCHPDVRAEFTALLRWGLVDVFHKHHPAGGIFSWWDYRMLGFPKNNGLRIDHILATDALACRSIEASVDREERKGQLPSDHAPVIARFAWP